MNKEKDLSKYQVRTDLAIDYVEEKKELEGVNHSTRIVDDIKITTVDLDNNNVLGKKRGKYITLEFEDVTDLDNRQKIIKILTSVLESILNLYDTIMGNSPAKRKSFIMQNARQYKLTGDDSDYSEGDE